MSHPRHLINKSTNAKYIHKYSNYHFKVDQINQKMTSTFSVLLLDINTLKLQKLTLKLLDY